MSTIGGALRDELTALLAPLASLGSMAGLRALLASLGHGDALAGQAGLQAALVRAADLADELASIDPAALATWDGTARVVQAGADVFAAVRAVEQAVADPTLAAQARELGEQLAGRLVALHLRTRWPRLHRAASLLTLIAPAELSSPSPLVVTDGKIVRVPSTDDTFQFARAGDLIARPWPTLRDFYLPDQLAHLADAWAAADRLFPIIGFAADSLGLRWFRDEQSLDPSPPPPSDDDATVDDLAGGSDAGSAVVDDAPPPAPSPVDTTAYLRRRMPRLVVVLPGGDGSARLAVAWVVSSAEHDGGLAGLIASVLGSLAWSETRGAWRLTAQTTGDVPAFVVGPTGLALAPTSAPVTGATGALSIERIRAPGEPAFVFGSATGSRLELGAVRFGIDFTLTPAQRALGLTIGVDQARLVLAPGDGDGLLGKLLPADGVALDCTAGLRLSSDGGVTLGVSVNGLSPSGEVAVGRSIGPVRIEALTGGLQPFDDARGSGLSATVGARLSAQLGPVTVSLEGPAVGGDLLWKLADPAQTPNLGVVHADGLGLRPPTGAGLAVDAALVQGGGALRLDPARHQYAGALALTIRDRIGLEVLGLLATRLPDGRAGFSLLVLGNSTFPPIPIGFGFQLTGLGVLVGVDRSIAIDALRAALLAGQLDAALFPADPAAHLAALLAALDAMFPARDGAFSIGILARITWGPNALATLDLGVFYDTSAPARLTALAQLLIQVPQVRLRLQALGVVDFDQGELDLQARLFDSRIVGFDVSGDAAVMMRWSAAPSFVLSIGGFHPAFQPPTEFQRRFGPLARIAIRPHMDDGALKLSLQAYLAVTSSTVQFGARLDLRLDVSAFSATGMLAFDALARFSPSFWFDVAIEGGVSLAVAGVTLLGAHLRAELTGPHPWWASGTATIEVLWWDVDYSFEIGTRTAPPDAAVLPGAGALARLTAALTDPHNWSSQLGSRAALVTVRRPAAADGLILHPLDELAVRTPVLPLGLPLERVDDRPLDAVRVFDLTGISVGGAACDRVPVYDDFARAQYQQLTDAQKLSAPSFEPMRAGVRAAPPATVAAPPAVQASWTWDEKVWAPGPPTPVVRQPAVIDAPLVATALATSAAAEAPLRRTGTARYRLARGAQP